MARRILTLWIASALAAVSMLASVPSPNCKIVKGRSGYQPLEPNQRLLYALNGLDVGTLEIRYLVSGSLYLTEVVDVSNVVLPQVRSECIDKSKPPAPLTLGILRDDNRDVTRQPRLESELLKGPRVLELLARDPDEVRELHRLAGEGTAIAVEAFHSGRRIESIPFAELVRRSADLRGGSYVPVTAVSDVRGTTRARRPVLSISRNDYLPDCNDCTESMPCDTECGYDPGKGGPVTCGEYSGICSPTCPASSTWNEYWTGWYTTSSGVYYFSSCLNNILYNRYWWWQRRDRIRQTRICPNSPSCDGCYITETVIDYEIRYVYCLSSSGAGCFNSELPCCAELCFPGDACSFTGFCHP